ncbi:MAG TPA: alpha/beta hydrolase [Caulobacteraceae bacterium]|nr:alpha/beta hydrolase [Caulobacteraceae bacterium]
MSSATTDMLRLPAREIPIPTSISPAAQAYLTPRPAPQVDYPPAHDHAAWRALIAAREQDLLPLLQRINPGVPAKVETREIDGARVFDITPAGAPADSRGIVLDMHGGGLFLCAGDLCRMMGIGLATRLQRRVWAVDYRMPPDHPYPAGLDDAVAVYRALLHDHSPQEIIVSGGSAGGNLAAALVLRTRDEGLPLPAGLLLNTPEIDLTESGDSFHTNLGVDPGLRSLMPVNLLYANGHDLSHPYLSPLFGDFRKGFPPTLLTTGTRDLYLSNTVRMHRALRAADIPAELHVVEAGGHGGFPGAPEGEEINREVRRFIQALWADL